MTIVDSHFHLVSPDRDRYPVHDVPLATRMPDHDPEVTWRDWKESGADFLARMDRAGVDRAVIVHSYPTYGYDCSFTIDAAEEFPDRYRAVVQFDPDGPDPEGSLLEMAKSSVVRGIRIRAIFEHRFLEPGAEYIWDAAVHAGLTIEALVSGLDGVAPWIERVAPLPVVVHGGAPPELVALGSSAPPSATVTELAALPNCSMKLSTPFLQAGGDGTDPAALVERVTSLFGAERVVWGTNYPATTGISYDDMVALGRHATRSLGAAERDALLGGNAMRLWAW